MHIRLPGIISWIASMPHFMDSKAHANDIDFQINSDIVAIISPNDPEITTHCLVFYNL